MNQNIKVKKINHIKWSKNIKGKKRNIKW